MKGLLTSLCICWIGLIGLEAAAYPGRIAFPDGLDQDGNKIYPGELSGITVRSKLPIEERLPFTTKEKAAFDRCKEADKLYEKSWELLHRSLPLEITQEEREKVDLQGLSLLIQAANYFHPSARHDLYDIFKEGKWGIAKQPARAMLYANATPFDWDFQYRRVKDEKENLGWARAQERKEARIVQRETAFLEEQERLAEEIQKTKTSQGNKYTKIS